MQNSKVFLQKDILSTEGIEHFNAWKEDILRATKSVLLKERTYWATVNRLIATHLDKDIYQTITSFFPVDYAEMEALDPTELLKQIEE